MIIGIVGSRSIDLCNIDRYVPEGVTEIVSGGAKRGGQVCERIRNAARLDLDRIFAGLQKIQEGSTFEKKSANNRICGYGNCILGWQIKRHEVCY